MKKIALYSIVAGLVALLAALATWLSFRLSRRAKETYPLSEC